MGEGAASAAFHEFLAGVFAYFSTKAFLANVVVNVLLGEFEYVDNAGERWTALR